MELFYIGVLLGIAWLTSNQIDTNNWENLRRSYREREQKLLEKQDKNEEL